MSQIILPGVVSSSAPAGGGPTSRNVVFEAEPVTLDAEPLTITMEGTGDVELATALAALTGNIQLGISAYFVLDDTSGAATFDGDVAISNANISGTLGVTGLTTVNAVSVLASVDVAGTLDMVGGTLTVDRIEEHTAAAGVTFGDAVIFEAGITGGALPGADGADGVWFEDPTTHAVTVSLP